MTREEEIIEAANKYYEYEYNECAANNGFIKGAQWADENPQSPWISVKEDLPCNPKYLKQPDYSSWVLAITENGEIIYAQMIIMHGKWIWQSHHKWKHEDIRYWMPIIPTLPKEYEHIWEVKL